jgi:ribosomal protein L29
MATKRKQMMAELRALDETQCRQREAQLRRRLYDLRSQAVTDKIADVSQFRKTGKEIARIETLLRQRRLPDASR